MEKLLKEFKEILEKKIFSTSRNSSQWKIFSGGKCKYSFFFTRPRSTGSEHVDVQHVPPRSRPGQGRVPNAPDRARTPSRISRKHLEGEVSVSFGWLAWRRLSFSCFSLALPGLTMCSGNTNMFSTVCGKSASTQNREWRSILSLARIFRCISFSFLHHGWK